MESQKKSASVHPGEILWEEFMKPRGGLKQANRKGATQRIAPTLMGSKGPQARRLCYKSLPILTATWTLSCRPFHL